MDAVDTLVFDVMGIVVDDEPERHDQMTALLTDSGLAPAQITALLSAWEEKMHGIRVGPTPWQGHRAVRRINQSVGDPGRDGRGPGPRAGG
jgi:hypothetical protein